MNLPGRVTVLAKIMQRIQAISMVVLFFAGAACASTVPQQWNAQWIAAPDGPARDYDVLYFRKSFSLGAIPQHFMVNVSADTRYELHVNGKRVSAGPALADVHHWRYEVCDLAPFLHPGTNVIAAIVWNFGTSAAVAQMSSQTGFLLAAEDGGNAAINTGDSWQVRHEKGRILLHERSDGYYAAGPPEKMDGRLMDWDWDAASAEGDWVQAASLGNAAPTGAQNSPTPWILVKDELPAMQYSAESAGHVVRVSGMAETSPDTSMLEKPVTIPAHAEVKILLDRGVLTTAFPSYQLSGGKDASLTATYAEALYDAHGNKGNRNEVAGRHIQGVTDEIIADGAARTYRTLWWRTWRYLQLYVKTGEQPLTIEGVRAYYTAYPFQKVASFESNAPDLTRIWDTGWLTAQLCAHETYMDTPYWEEMQYIGDTRIQALISYAVTGDDRLARQAIMAYRDSVLTDGLTQSRYPSSLTQVIPPFSLLWVSMLHDYWMYRDDPEFVRSILPNTRGVLDWFSARQRPDGLLNTIEWWPFVDWTATYPDGVPPQDADGGSSAITLQFIEALRNAAALERQMGEPERAQAYEDRARRAADGLMKLNWDAGTQLLADTPSKKSYSQEANALAVWLDVIPKSDQLAVMKKVLQVPEDSATRPEAQVKMSESSYYFRFYLARAMVHAGLGDMYYAQLDPWRKMLAMGLSTWAETPEPTRSDSHAWSAHPTYDLLTIVAGIAPASPDFAKVEIAPHLGALTHVEAKMPTPKGLVAVNYTKAGAEWSAQINLPEGLSGDFVWQGKTIPLHSGDQHLKLE